MFRQEFERLRLDNPAARILPILLALGGSLPITVNLNYLESQRLEVEEWYRLHPDTEERPLDAPLFGVSLPRTGSTALSPGYPAPETAW